MWLVGELKPVRPLLLNLEFYCAFGLWGEVLDPLHAGVFWINNNPYLRYLTYVFVITCFLSARKVDLRLTKAIFR